MNEKQGNAEKPLAARRRKLYSSSLDRFSSGLVRLVNNNSGSNQLYEKDNSAPTRYQQLFVLALLYLAYAIYLFCRKNYTFWLDALLSSDEFSLTKSSAGSIGSSFELASGFSKIALAVVVDSHSPRYILCGALLLSALTNVGILLVVSNAKWFISLTSSTAVFVLVLSGIWSLNGLVQGLGWPALAKIFMSWFPNPADRGFWYGFLSTNQNVGAALVPLLLLPAIDHYGWTAALAVPAFVGAGVALATFFLIRDSPGEEHESNAAVVPPSPARLSNSTSTSTSSASSTLLTSSLVYQEVLGNSSLWLLSLSYFFVSIARSGLGDWAIKFLHDSWLLDVDQASTCLVYLEIGGFVGSLVGGILSDKVFDGKRAPVIGLFSALIIAPVALLSMRDAIPPTMIPYVPNVAYLLFGFFSFTPHMMIGLAAREWTQPRMQATAGGLVKFVAQVGSAAAGAPLGFLMDRYGWSCGLATISVMSGLSLLLMVPVWSKCAGPTPPSTKKNE